MARKKYFDKLCERCAEMLTIPGERFCKECKEIKIAEMTAAGYLNQRHYGPAHYPRPIEAQENTRETSRGLDR